MPNLGSLTKYISLFSLGKGFIDKVVVEKILHGAVQIIAATVVVAILAGALVLTVLGAIYYALVSYLPIQEWAAVLIVAALTIIIIVLIVRKITAGLSKIASATTLLTHTAMPTSPVTSIISSFIDGLKAGKQKTDNNQQHLRPVRKNG